MENDVKILFVDFVGFERTVKVMSYAKGLASTVNNPISNAISSMDERIENFRALENYIPSDQREYKKEDYNEA